MSSLESGGLDWLPKGVAAHPVDSAQKSKKGLALSVPYDFRQARFEVCIDTITLNVSGLPDPERASLAAELKAQLGVSVRQTSEFAGAPNAHPLGSAGIVIQDISPSVAAKLTAILQRRHPGGREPPLFEVHVALDARLANHTTHEDDHMARWELFGALVRHLLVDPEITQGSGGMRWYFSGTHFARFRSKDTNHLTDYKTHYRHIDPKATVYIGTRWSDLEYMVIHKITDHRHWAGATSLASHKRRVRVEARVRGAALVKYGMQTVSGLSDPTTLRGLARLFQFRCPVITDPRHGQGIASPILRVFASRQAADFAAAGVWGVVDREIWQRGTTRRGQRIRGARVKKKRLSRDGARRYTEAARAYRVIAHGQLGSIVDRAFRKFAKSMSTEGTKSV